MSKYLLFFAVFSLFIQNTIANNPPSDISLSNLSVNEGNLFGASIAIISGVDVDSNDSLTLELATGNGVNDADNNSFYIQENFLKANFIADFETKPSYHILLKATDKSNATFTKEFVIQVLNRKSPKFDISVYTRRSPINYLLKDGENTWVAANGGLALLDSEGNTLNTYYTSNGLISNEVLSLTKDLAGNIWVGTSAGISKFDGDQWTSYNQVNGIPSFAINSVCSMSNGHVWAATWGGGVAIYNGSSWSVTTEMNGLIDNYVNVIKQAPDGKIWVGTASGITVFNGASKTNYTTSNGLVDNQVFSFTFDATGAAWIGTFWGLSKFYQGNFTNFTTADGLPENWILSEHIDADGNLWMGTLIGACKYDGNQFSIYDQNNGLNDELIYSICQGSGEDIWFSGENGISVFDGSNFSYISFSSGICNNIVKDIFVDVFDKKWIATQNGVSIFDNTSWNSMSTFDGLVDDRVNALDFDLNGNAWFATSGGISKLHETLWTDYTTDNGLPVNSISDVTKDAAGNKWFATQGGGVLKYTGSKWINYTTATGLASNVVACVYVDQSDRKWFGTSSGLTMLQGASFQTFTTSNGLPSNQIKKVTQSPNGLIWVATWGGGLARWNGSSWQVVNQSVGLPSNNLYSVTADSSNLIWIGSESGLTKYNGINFETYNTSNGLSSNSVYSVTVDQNGVKWLATAIGMNKLSSLNSVPSSIYLSKIAVPENASLDQFVARIFTEDLDVDDQFSYSFQSADGVIDADNPKFSIANDSLIVNGAFDYESQKFLNIYLESSDGYSGIVRKDFVLEVENINDNVPSIPNYTFRILEQSPANTFVGNVYPTDADGNLNPLNLSIVEGNVDNAFTILNNGRITVSNAVAIDFETYPFFEIKVRVTDGTFSDTSLVHIDLNDIAEVDVNAYDNLIEIDENLPVNWIVGVVNASGGEPLPLNFSFSAGNESGAFFINTISGELKIADQTKIDYEQTDTFHLKVLVSNGVDSDLADILVVLQNLNDNAPVSSGLIASINENAPNGTRIGKLTATDEDGSITPISYTITSGNEGGAFTINTNTGEVRVAKSTLMDYEQNHTFTLVVAVFDGLNSSDAQVIVNLVNLNDNSPNITSLSFDLNENPDNGAEVGTVLTTDPDGELNNLSYVIIDGNNSNTFDLNPTTGELTILDSSLVDYEQIQSFILVVQVSDGVNTVNMPLTVIIKDITEVGIDRVVNAEFSIWPNPCKNYLYTDGSDQINSYEILDLTGRKIQSENFQKNTAINVSDLKTGIYLLRLISDEKNLSTIFVKD